MNSDSLYTNFYEEYEDLFVNYDLIISMPSSVIIAWWTAWIFGSPVISQSIPQRAYFGFKKNTNRSLSWIVSYKRFNYRTHQFEQMRNNWWHAPDNCFVDRINFLYQDIQVDISILTEFEWKNADLISGGIILWMDIFCEKIDQEIIWFLSSPNISILHQNIYIQSLFRNILSLRTRYNETAIGISCLDWIVNWLIHSQLPIIHMHWVDKKDELAIKTNVSGQLIFNSPLYITKKMEEFSPQLMNKELPFDIMIFSLWDYQNIEWYQTFLNWQENSNEAKELMGVGISESSKLPFLKNWEIDTLLEKSIDVISAYIFNVIKIFLNTLLAKEKVSSLFFHLKRNVELSNTLLWKNNLWSHEREDIDYISLKKFIVFLYPELHEDNLFIYTTWSSFDLKYVVFLPRYLSVHSEEFINSKIQQYCHKASSLIYSSKNDGFSKEWFKIEQFLSKNIYHAHFWRKKIIIIDKNNLITLYSHQEEAISMASTGILLDTITKKLFINGEKINSKDILSQNTTVNILSLLFENLWKDIENSELPRSSYSKNKNEMTGKIILPLLKLIERKLWYQLPLVCKGTMWEFYLKLNKPEVDIFILKKRQSS